MEFVQKSTELNTAVQLNLLESVYLSTSEDAPQQGGKERHQNSDFVVDLMIRPLPLQLFLLPPLEKRGFLLLVCYR